MGKWYFRMASRSNGNALWQREGDFSKRPGTNCNYLLEESFPEGAWKCHVEQAGDRIVAYAINFISVQPPVLDKGEASGSGRFLDAEYPPWLCDANGFS